MIQPIAALTAWDHALFQAINSHHALFFDRLFAVITQLGNGWVSGPLLAALVAWKFRGPLFWRVFAVSTIAMTLSGVANDTIKGAVDRPRPPLYFSAAADGGAPRYAVHVVGPRFNRNSFPSGHANTAFSAAALLSILFGGAFWLAYAVAALVAYSRVYMGVHFPFDTVAGGLLAVVVVYGVWFSAMPAAGFRWSVRSGIRRKETPPENHR
jgi:membrane-associated phospholipid phosphatase